MDSVKSLNANSYLISTTQGLKDTVSIIKATKRNWIYVMLKQRHNVPIFKNTAPHILRAC